MDSEVTHPVVARGRRPGDMPWGLIALSVVPSVFLVGPLVALVWRTLPSGRWLEALGSTVVRQALG